MEINIEENGGALAIFVQGRVDTVTAPELEKKFNEAMAREENRWVLLLSGLDYISSAGLRVILSAAKSLKVKGGELHLADARDPVKKVFEISGFFTLFKYFETKDDALEAF
jgi:anti-anti-sigma factor